MNDKTSLKFSLLATFIFGMGVSVFALSNLTKKKADSGASEDAIAHNLYMQLKANNFDALQVDPVFTYLPNQDFSEDPMYHGHQNAAFSMPLAFSDFYKGQVAFYSAIHARMNRRGVRKDKDVVSPSGYWIVCDWEGNLTHVPTNDVRFYNVSAPGQEGRYKPVFPGMREYAAGEKHW